MSSGPWPAEKKTHHEPQAPTVGGRIHAEALVERYEHLRREVLAHEVGSQLGLAVLLGQGMVGWMKVQSLLAAAPNPPARHREQLTPVPKTLAGELTRILTELILTRREFA